MCRPEKPIDWARVDKLLMSGCEGVEIAPHFNMHVNTFYERVAKQYGMSFTEYSCSKKKEGDSILLEKQYDKAVEGDNTMLIWLGKQRMNQSDKSKDDINASLTIKHIDATSGSNNPPQIPLPPISG